MLDEPTVGVCPQNRNAILKSVEKLSGERMAVLYTTTTWKRPTKTLMPPPTPGSRR
jgi:ABC-type multidrug transport system ATPase subunit